MCIPIIYFTKNMPLYNIRNSTAQRKLGIKILNSQKLISIRSSSCYSGLYEKSCFYYPE